MLCNAQGIFKLAAQVLPWIEACSIDEVIDQDGQTSTPVSRRDALCEKLRDPACQMRTRCRMPDSWAEHFTGNPLLQAWHGGVVVGVLELTGRCKL